MRISHKLTLQVSPAEAESLTSLGLEVTEDGWALFDIDEADSRWPYVESLLACKGKGTIVTTKFTKKELDSAAWLTIRALLYHGYPEPHDDDDSYLELTYDLSDYCEKCGLGLRQKAPFRMRGEPKWGKRGLIQMYWVYDELFVTPEVWESVFAPFGIGRREVLSRGGRELTTVVQLVIEGEADVDVSAMAWSVCPNCGRTKHHPDGRGFAPPLTSTPSAPLAKTRQLFGSGALATPYLLASQELRQALLAAGVKGAGFTPLAG
jgi:hypothetical protein